MKKIVVSLLLMSLLSFNVYAFPADAKQSDYGQRLGASTMPSNAGHVQKSEKKYAKENRGKISADLLKLLDDSAVASEQTKQQTRGQLKSMNALLTKEEAASKGMAPASDDLVYVYITLNPGSNIHIVEPFVHNVTNQNQNINTIAAWVEVGKLDGLTQLPEVKSLETVYPPVTNSGSITSEGDDILGTESFRNLSGIDGTGMKIGIISDGMDSYASAVATGDLPSDVTVLRNTLGGDEGTAMAEIVYDIAPGAELYFHDAGTNTLDFIDAIESLANQGVNIIVDDIGWITEPFFEDGQVALAIKSILASNDILYVSSAGNAAETHYQGTFRNDGTSYHDFDTNVGPTLLPVYIPPGGTIRTVLQWNDKFGSSVNDYDMYMYDTNSMLLDYSEGIQNGQGDPIETIWWTNYSSVGQYAYIDVYKYSGAAKNLELYVYGAGILNHGTAADSIFGHPALPEVIAVGTTNASNPNEIAPYSSQGPVTISYPTAQTRAKPDVSGIDGVSVTGAGGFPSPFYGTSAAAPHVAATAALIWAQNPTKDASQIRNLLRQGTVDLGTSGYDYIYGYGRENVFYATSPSKPTGLELVPGDSGAAVSWQLNTEPDLAGYQLEYKASTASTWTIRSVSKTASSYPVTGLVNGVTYQFRLKAKDAAGNWSAYTDVTTGTPVDNVAPPVPAGLKVKSVNDKQVTLTWTAVTASDLAGYQIEYKEATEPTWSEVSVGKVTTCTLTGLTNDEEYSFQIKAKDTSNNLSAPSSTVSGTPADKMPPAVPAGLRVASMGADKNINLTWNANTELDLAGYEIAYQKYGTTTWSSKTVGAGVNNTAIDGLVHNVRYTFKIRAQDQKGNWSNYSSTIYAVPKDQTAPAAPTGLGSQPGDRSMLLSWESNTEQDLAGYQLEYKASTARTWTIRSVSKTASNYPVTGLVNGVTYQFRLKAKDAAGNWSAYTDVTTGTPVDNVAPPVPAGLKVKSVNDMQVTLGWMVVTAPDLAGYQIEYKKTADSTWIGVSVGKVITYTLTDLINDEEYSFQIKAKDTSNNLSAPSSTVSGTPADKMPPAVPAGLRVASIGADKNINLTWNANLESDLAGYEIAYQKYGTTTWSSKTIGAGVNNTAIDGLVHNVRYTFKIRAQDQKGNWSNYSSTIYAVPKDQTAPAAPTGLVSQPGDRSMLLSWESNTEQDLAGYQLEYKASTARTWTIRSVSKTASNYPVTGLVNGVNYQFRLKAKDVAGNWSNYSDIIIDMPAPF